MTCEECGQDRPLTYRSRTLGKRSVCAPCIRSNHPETVDMGVLGVLPPPEGSWQDAARPVTGVYDHIATCSRCGNTIAREDHEETWRTTGLDWPGLCVGGSRHMIPGELDAAQQRSHP